MHIKKQILQEMGESDDIVVHFYPSFLLEF